MADILDSAQKQDNNSTGQAPPVSLPTDTSAPITTIEATPPPTVNTPADLPNGLSTGDLTQPVSPTPIVPMSINDAPVDSSVMDSVLSTTKNEPSVIPAAGEAKGPEPEATIYTPPGTPLKKNGSKKGLILSVLLLLFITLPLIFYYVTQQRQVAEIRSRATGPYPDYSGCTDNSQCASGICEVADPHTGAKICKPATLLPDYSGCTDNSQCASGICSGDSHTTAKVCQPAAVTPSGGGTGAVCTVDSQCQSLVCSFGKCAGGCGGFGESECYTHVNCNWNANTQSCQNGAAPTPPNGPCQITCTADASGIKVQPVQGTDCSGAVASVTWYSSRCGGTSGSCSGISSGGSGGLPFSRGITGAGCSWQSDVSASTSKGGSCSNGGSGTISGCDTTPGTTPGTTPTPTTPTTPGAPQCQNLKVYKGTAQLTATDMSNLKAGDSISVVVVGTAAGATKGRIRLNGGAWTESTTAASGGFAVPFTIPAGTTNFTFEGELFIDSIWK